MKLINRAVLFATAIAAVCLFASSCKTEADDDPYTGLKLIATTNAVTSAGGTVTLKGVYYNEDSIDSSVTVSYSLSGDTTSSAYFGTSGTISTTGLSNSEIALTLGSVAAGQVKVTATYGDYSAVLYCGVTASTSSISASDLPTGFASIDWSASAGASSSYIKTVTTRADLVSYAKKGGYIIYVSGMIDMSEGMLPTTGGGTTTSLDSFVNSKSSGAYTTYSAWKSAYGSACSTSTEDGDSDSTTKSSLYTMLWTLNNAYKSVIQLVVASNTTIIGADSESGIKGGAISISGASNVMIRNLIIQDAYDPFPHHESNDGYNAQHDAIGLQGSSSNIWIDHCTLKDTMTCISVSGEKWQTYDGLCDMKSNVSNITVSYCKFMNHDKTMLIGSSDSDGSSDTRTITLHHNYFLNCVQRLPMVRNAKIHIYNNYYNNDSSTYNNSYCIGLRAGNKVYAEGNYFGSVTPTSESYGDYYFTNNTGCSGMGSKVWEPSTYYAYTADSASTAKSTVESGAGAGTCTVITD